MAKSIMIQGTTSSAGKSFLTAALCRIFAQDGYRVAPFKSQNMALNSFITEEGLEMGRAQVMQAEAAGVKPSVRMNPILLKPTGDTGSQVIVNGEVRGNMTAREYFALKRSLFSDVMDAYHALAAEYDILVIAGAGTPAAAPPRAAPAPSGRPTPPGSAPSAAGKSPYLLRAWTGQLRWRTSPPPPARGRTAAGWVLARPPGGQSGPGCPHG